ASRNACGSFACPSRLLALPRLRLVMAEQAGDVGLIRLLIEHDIVNRGGSFLRSALGCGNLRSNITMGGRFSLRALEAPAAPTGLVRKPRGARVGDEYRNLSHVSSTT